MQYNLKPLIVVMAIALAVFVLAKPFVLRFTAPEDYARDFGVSTDLWPRPQPASADCVVPPTQLLEEAALAYREFRLQHHAVADADVNSWCASYSGDRACAGLFRDLHRADPRAAERLARAATDWPETRWSPS